MARTPKKPVDKVQFFEDHITPWTTNATAIGTTAALVTALGTKTQAARDAYTAQQAARQAAITATNAFKIALGEMNDAGQGILKQIDAMAQSSGNPSVYTLAEVPPPATPTPQGDPGKPFGFTVEIGTVGELNLRWKNTNAAGAVYIIYRRLGATGEFQNLGGVGRKEFTDYNVPAGTAQVQYQIQAVRSTGKSDWTLFVVNLGAESGMATVLESTPAKLAA